MEIVINQQDPQPFKLRGVWFERLTRLLVSAAIMIWKLTTDDARQVINRYLTHATILALALVVLALGGLPVFQENILASRAEAMPVLTNMQASATASLVQSTPTPFFVRNTLGRFYSASDIEIVQRQALPHTEIPTRLRLDVITYTVLPGDTVQGIAITYGLKDTTIMWSNPAIEDMPDFLRIGQQVVILPLDGVYHTVKEGDTLQSIAKKYKVETSAITDVSYNHLQGPDYKIEPGTRLIVAGGEKPYVPKVVTAYNGPVPEGSRGTGLFLWPATGSLTQGYWWGHRALDIAAYTGAPLYAADSGFVSFAGWTDIGYGYMIIIDHANGYATYYAHCSGFYVSVGQAVNRGQLIGTMGSTGNSTGPHVHFEIRLGDTLLNPRAYLP
jgi:murein DD-endopeptidase MepM/ murein hydrolase activator NlpD